MRSVFGVIMCRFSLRLLICVLGISLFGQSVSILPALAANTTDAASIRVIPGSATLVGSPEIIVTALYTGDDNADNSILIEWGYDGVDFTLGSQNSSNHPVSPYTFTITSLDNANLYQVRITFNDPDNSQVVKTVTGLRPYNPMIHNAVSTGSGSSKWASGWGTVDAGSEYGEFKCFVCHDRDSANIKRVRKDWSDGSLPLVPVKADGGTVDFQSTLNGSAQFALDDTSGHATSNRICESCHTKTVHHLYNQVATADHYSDQDCISCHKHSDAFSKPTCSSCHGGGMSGSNENSFWPGEDLGADNPGSDNDAGEHTVHIERLAMQLYGYTLQGLLDNSGSQGNQVAICAYCHLSPGSGAEHAKGDDVGDLSDFLAMDGSADSGTSGTYSSGSCSSVDCHNGIATASPGWYAGGSSSCSMCHTANLSNVEAIVDPSSGLHYSASPNGSLLHDDSFSGGGVCTTCHTSSPSDGHFNNMVNTPDTAVFNFQSSASIDIKLNTLSDVTDDTCAADCHRDNGEWYRFWSADAFDGTPFDTSDSAAVTATIAQALPPGCNVCHGEFINGWAEGSAHYNMDVDNDGNSGGTHNSQNLSTNPGAACVDCHLYPDHMTPGDGLLRHENDLITLTDDQTVPDDYTPYDDQEGTRTGVYCADCHEASVSPRDGNDANTFEYSLAFPGWANVEVVPTDRNPIYTCFSGATGCHGDTSNNWWPNIDSTDPVAYPNREGAHYEHGTTIGELLAEQANADFPGTRTDADGNGRVDATQEDRNKTCNFCHPMAWNAAKEVWESLYHRIPTPETSTVVTDVFGGYIFPGADKKGVYISGNPLFGGDAWSDIDTNGATGFAYQLEPDPLNPGLDPRYPLDHDGEYWQYLDAYADNSAVRHGVCSNVSCHSNAPFTPQWYGDEQPPAAVGDLQAFTHRQEVDTVDPLTLIPHQDHNIYEHDDPGTVHLYWTAPGDNGNFSGTAYEYEVYFSKAGPISDANLASATRAGGAVSVLRQGEIQEMVVDGLEQGTPYWFAVVTKDQPTYIDDNHDDIYDFFVSDGLRSLVGATASSQLSHDDDVDPVFWGLTSALSHDTGGAINLNWDAARDHTLPLTYLVYWSEYSIKTHLANGGSMPTLTKPAEYDGGVYSFGFTEGSPPTPGGSDYYISVSTTTGMSYQMTSLSEGVLYNVLVRAEDGYDPIGDGTGTGNIDDNTVVSMALPNIMGQEMETTKMIILTGTSGMVQTDPLNPVWGTYGTNTLANTDTMTFTDSGDLDGADSRDMLIQGISFDILVTNNDRRLNQDFIMEIGYDTGGGFTQLGSDYTVTIARKATRIMKIGISNLVETVPANANMAVRITRAAVQPSGSVDDITFEWGDNASKGQLMLSTQPINHEPTAPVINEPILRQTGGYLDITWTPSSDSDGDTQTLHYDIFGSADDGITFPYVIGIGLTDADASGGVRWDTVGDGLDMFHAGSYDCKIRIDVSDGYLYEKISGSNDWYSHNSTTTGTITVDNSQDDEAPAAVYINHVEPRPKQGAAFLHWIAVGNDGYNHGTRASYYDIRFRKTADVDDIVTRWDDALTVKVEGEPVPGFAGTAEEFELLNMAPDTSYEVAIVTCDSGEDDVPLESASPDDNCSGLSNVYTITSGQYYCGLCHSTPPDEPDTKGVHREHGYTLEDCANCHGDGTGPDDGIGAAGPNDITQYDGRHYDGVVNIGWSKDINGDHLMIAQIAPTDTNGVSVDQGAGVIYSDPDGAGGYNSGGVYTDYANTDSGRCMNFIGANANGCHGPFTPQWAPDTVEMNPPVPACSDCHGDTSALRDTDPYGRVWDCNVGGAPSELVKASPPTANHGGTTTDDRYVGAHLLHLNSSFRFAKGDSCRLCHKDTFDLGQHADGTVDINFDAVADQDEVTPADTNYDTADTTGMTCSSLNNLYCHDTGANWAEPGAQCNGCHNMSGKDFNPGDPDSVDKSNYIGHVWDGGIARECIHCHVAGHPQSPDGIVSGDSDALLLNNNAAIGINYRSGGVHLRQYSGNPSDPNGSVPYRTTMNDASAIDTLAETCWGCHEDNGISEWGVNNSVASGSSPYNFGTLDQVQWTGAIWESGYPTEFAYKKGYIQSTHTTDPTGTSVVNWDSVNGRYNETPDPISKIRCSNCHDVHDSNLAKDDTMTGRPYLRGTWKANPYEEDGAPWSTQTYTEPDDAGTTADDYSYGAVPRGGTLYSELGGYYIDQNNVVPGTGNTTQTRAAYPTSGWTISSSAGLCTLCHGTNVDEMDQLVDEDPAVGDQNKLLWLGSNGHSNSVLGGSFANAENIFDQTHGRPAPTSYNWGKARPSDTSHWPVLVGDTSFSNQGDDVGAGGAYRGRDGNAGGYNPPMTDDDDGYPYGFNHYDWGGNVDNSPADTMFHQFSCSKCHNPHASRLPKLMITNCLDIRHNTWDDTASSTQTLFTASALDRVDRNMPAAYYVSAQNCHRFDAARGDEDNNNVYEDRTKRGGWNKVTPWVNDNLTNTEHKGSTDPAYGTSNTTSPWRHSDFPTEPDGW